MKTRVALAVMAVMLLCACVAVVVLAAVLLYPEVSKKTASGGYATSIDDTGCSVTMGSKRGEWDFAVAISGPRQDTAVVDVTLPGESQPLPVRWQLPKKFIDTEELYIHQIYDYDVNWQTGRYTLSVVNGAKRGTTTFQLNEEADWTLYVYCE
jgi:hypothetical protein